MITELDFATSAGYVDTEENRAAEYEKMAECHRAIFEKLQELNAEDGITIGGITVWGVVESTSWLHIQVSDRVQCPLLFDGDYQAKPAFWAYFDDLG